MYFLISPDVLYKSLTSSLEVGSEENEKQSGCLCDSGANNNTTLKPGEGLSIAILI